MLTTILFAAAALAEQPSLNDAPVPQDLNTVNFGGDLVPFVGTSAVEPEQTVRRVSANLIGGYTYGIQGVEGAAGFNIESGFVHGVQGAGGFNIDLGALEGAQGAGGFNYAGVVEGVQGAGGLNISRTEVQGVQGAGGVNYAGGALDGVQLSGGLNVARDVAGMQGAGGLNVAMGDLRGVQGSGGANVVMGDVRGVQGAGGLNLAVGQVQGVQLAPLNIASGEADVQIGVVNIAPNADIGLGIVNIYWEGRNHIDVWTDSQGFAYTGFKSGSRYIHNIYAVGAQVIGGEQTWTVGMGIGGHVPMAKRAALDLDFMAHQVNEGGRWCSYFNMLSQARAVLVVNPLENVGLYAGPTYDVRMQDSRGSFRLEARPGVTAGIQLF